MIKKIISLLMLALIVTACSSNKDASMTAGAPAVDETSAPLGNQPKNDDEIVNMLMTVNSEEMNLAKLGKKQAQNKKVRDFASHMMSMHAKSNDEAAMLRAKEKISLTETKPSNIMKIVTEDRIEAMRGKKGKAFDKAFIQAQVELHQKTLEKLELTMIPNAQNPQLIAMLKKTKDEVKHHLEMAQKLETSVQ